MEPVIRGLKWIGGQLSYALIQFIKMIIGLLMLSYMATSFIIGGLVFLTVTAFVAGAHSADRLAEWVTKED